MDFLECPKKKNCINMMRSCWACDGAYYYLDSGLRPNALRATIAKRNRKRGIRAERSFVKRFGGFRIPFSGALPDHKGDVSSYFMHDTEWLVQSKAISTQQSDRIYDLLKKYDPWVVLRAEYFQLDYLIYIVSEVSWKTPPDHWAKWTLMPESKKGYHGVKGWFAEAVKDVNTMNKLQGKEMKPLLTINFVAHNGFTAFVLKDADFHQAFKCE